MKKKALYLSGGGARAAYQSGVLKAISDIVKPDKMPINILSSVSAGAINATFLASHANNFNSAVIDLIELWSSITCDKVYETSNLNLIKSLARNIYGMAFHHKMIGGGYLLDTSPLKDLIKSYADFNKIKENITSGTISDFEVATSCYDLATNISFYKSQESITPWKRARHQSCAVDIEVEHILASAAMPLFFPAVKINDLHYGDGELRLTTPLRASIQLGAEKILVINTRKMYTESKQLSTKPIFGDVSYAKVLGAMLNALFLDNLDRDIELLNKINSTVQLLPPEQYDKSKWRYVDILCISPSVDLDLVAREHQYNIPTFLKYLIGAFGSKEQSGDLLSFLLFDPKYSKAMIDIGYNDAMNKKEHIIKFFGS